MDIVLIFVSLSVVCSCSNTGLQSGPFSAVNTAFIIAMNPNPGDMTNLLLAQLI